MMEAIRVTGSRWCVAAGLLAIMGAAPCTRAFAQDGEARTSAEVKLDESAYGAGASSRAVIVAEEQSGAWRETVMTEGQLVMAVRAVPYEFLADESAARHALRVVMTAPSRQLGPLADALEAHANAEGSALAKVHARGLLAFLQAAAGHTSRAYATVAGVRAEEPVAGDRVALLTAHLYAAKLRLSIEGVGSAEARSRAGREAAAQYMDAVRRLEPLSVAELAVHCIAQEFAGICPDHSAFLVLASQLGGPEAASQVPTEALVKMVKRPGPMPYSHPDPTILGLARQREDLSPDDFVCIQLAWARSTIYNDTPCGHEAEVAYGAAARAIMESGASPDILAAAAEELSRFALASHQQENGLFTRVTIDPIHCRYMSPGQHRRNGFRVPVEHEARVLLAMAFAGADQMLATDASDPALVATYARVLAAAEVFEDEELIAEGISRLASYDTADFDLFAKSILRRSEAGRAILAVQEEN